MSEAKRLPCPFCGCEADIKRVERGNVRINGDPNGRIIVCCFCGAQTRVFWAVDEKDAITTWNIRETKMNIQIGDYTLSYYHDGNDYWLEHNSGEGTQVHQKDMETLINAFYKKVF